MKSFCCALGGFLVVMLITAGSSADDNPKTNKDRIVGVWKVIKLAPGFPAGKMCRFTKEGKVQLYSNLSLKFQLQGQPVEGVVEAPMGAGTYEVDDKMLKIVFKAVGKEKKDFVHVTTIIKLTDKELETKDKNGNINQFKRK